MIAAFLIAFAVRLCYIAVREPRVGEYFLALSNGLFHGGTLNLHGVVTTQYEPLYPLFLTVARAVAGDHPRGVAVIQAALDATGAALLFALAVALTGRRRVAWIAAVLFAIDPLMVWHAAVGTEFSLAGILLLAASLAVTVASSIGGAIAAGALFGLATLTRTALAPAALLVGSVLALRGRGRAALALLVASAVVVAPWLARNASVNGAWAPTRVGLNLFIAVSPEIDQLLPDDNPDLLVELAADAVRRQNGGSRDAVLVPHTPEEDRQIDDVLFRAALDEAQQHPLRVLRSRLTHAAYLFWPRLVPAHETTPETRLVRADGVVRVEGAERRPLVDELAYSISFVTIAVAAAFGIWTRRRSLADDAALWAVVGTIVVTHAVFFPATRYRVPMEFVLLLYAAVGLDAIRQRSEASASRRSNFQPA